MKLWINETLRHSASFSPIQNYGFNTALFRLWGGSAYIDDIGIGTNAPF